MHEDDPDFGILDLGEGHEHSVDPRLFLEVRRTQAMVRKTWLRIKVSDTRTDERLKSLKWAVTSLFAMLIMLAGTVLAK